jgi:nicotinamide riboside kinase
MKTAGRIALIALVGAESTGKTTLARELAARLGGISLPEVLREFCDKQGRVPRRDEQRHITRHQIQAEAAAALRAEQQGASLIFVDCTPLMTAIYSELLFSDSTLVAGAIAHHANYTATLFLQPDIGWQADGIQRDGAHMQAPVTQALARYLPQTSTPFALVDGSGTARLQNALAAVCRLSKLTGLSLPPPA